MAVYHQYRTPADLLRDDTVSLEKKQEMLVLWCDEEEALQRKGGNHSNLKHVQRALIKLLSSNP